MHDLVADFLKSHSGTLGHLVGFSNLKRDLKLTSKSGSRRASIDAAVLSKHILMHHYDSITEQPIAKAFKAHVICNTLFICGDYNNAH